jgi:anti-anti-sigma factor
MSSSPPTLTVRRIDDSISIIAIVGELTFYAEDALTAAYVEADGPATRTIVMDFSGLDYMNSGGIGLLVTLHVRMQRKGQRMLAIGLGDHERRIFSMTRLDEAIPVYDSEEAALAAARVS